MIFCVLASLDNKEKLLGLIHGETGTLGVRIRHVCRSVLPRTSYVAETSLGRVRVKKAQVPGWALSISPEHDDVARIAKEKKMPLKLVYNTIVAELSAQEQGPGAAQDKPPEPGG